MSAADYITGHLDIEGATVPRVSTKWSSRDRWSAIKVRWSVGRMKYRVKPDVYAVGNPDRNSRVFVTASYKLSFDHLRRALEGMDAWILVLDTKGINVWCAAGKGTFGTKELVRRIRIHHLDKLVDHRKIIVPQLGATGVAAHEVKKMTGFTVLYGPVKASDIKAFIDGGMKATDSMRRVTFPFIERARLIPVDIFYGRYYMLLVPLLFILFSGFTPEGYSGTNVISSGWKTTVNLFAGYFTGCVVTPIMLPWVPFRRFSMKGLALGVLVALLLGFTGILGETIPEMVSWLMMMGGLSSFMAMNFTGSSTFTSLSGVQKEMKTALPMQVGLVAVGLALWIITRFFEL